MLFLFRKIRRAFLSQGAFTKYLLYAVGEIILVVIGILIALQINTWSEGQKMKKLERTYLQGFVEDLNADIRNLDGHRNITRYNKRAAENIRSIIQSKGNASTIDSFPLVTNIENDTLNFLLSLSRAGFMVFPKVTFYTLDGLKASGNTSLIRDDALRKAIFTYYSDIKVYDDWIDQKLDAQLVLQRMQSELTPPEIRLLTNVPEERKYQYIRENTIDIPAMFDRIRAFPGLEPALNGVIYSSERLLTESESREQLAIELIERIEGSH